MCSEAVFSRFLLFLFFGWNYACCQHLRRQAFQLDGRSGLWSVMDRLLELLLFFCLGLFVQLPDLGKVTQEVSPHDMMLVNVGADNLTHFDVVLG